MLSPDTGQPVGGDHIRGGFSFFWGGVFCGCFSLFPPNPWTQVRGSSAIAKPGLRKPGGITYATALVLRPSARMATARNGALRHGPRGQGVLDPGRDFHPNTGLTSAIGAGAPSNGDSGRRLGAAACSSHETRARMPQAELHTPFDAFERASPRPHGARNGKVFEEMASNSPASPRIAAWTARGEFAPSIFVGGLRAPGATRSGQAYLPPGLCPL